MTVYIADVEEIECPYCHKTVYPHVKREMNQLRKICPKCVLTIEVVKMGKKNEY